MKCEENENQIRGSRHALSNAYLIAAVGVDTSENGPLKVWERQ